MDDISLRNTGGRTVNRALPEDSLSRFFFDTEEVLALFRSLDDLLEDPATRTNGKGLAVLGPPRCGKTSLVEEYVRRCRNCDVTDRGGEGVTRHPLKVLQVTLQPGTRLNNIANQTLQELRHPAPSNGNQDTRTSRVVHEVLAGRYDLVVYDEIHHLVSSETRKVRENGSHWLTHILDRTRCPMVLVGYSDFRDILNENGFLGGRLVPALPLRPYSSGDRKSFAMFRGILYQFENGLGFGESSDLDDEDTARRILVLCNGRIGLLENFLTHARRIARRRKHNCLRRDTLSEAATDVRNTWCRLLFNPFEVGDLDSAIKKFGTGYALDDDSSSRSKGS